MELDIRNLTEAQEEEKDIFVNKLESKLAMDLNRNEILEDTEWIDMVIFTAPHIMKALNKWNKRIVVEEEVIKWNLSKKYLLRLLSI